MNYSNIISYIYALLAVSYGTFICITYLNTLKNISLLIIFIIILWLFLFIVIIFPNKYIFLSYAIIATILISYDCYINIYNNYYDYDDYNNYKENTIGIIKSQEYCDNDKNICYSNIEYLIDNVKHDVKILTLYYKVGENVKIYYNKDNPDIIKIYDKDRNKKIIKIIIYAIIILLLWIFLIFYISLIFKTNKKYLKKLSNYP